MTWSSLTSTLLDCHTWVYPTRREIPSNSDGGGPGFAAKVWIAPCSLLVSAVLTAFWGYYSLAKMPFVKEVKSSAYFS